MKTLGIAAMALACACIAYFPKASIAGTLPNISGTWYAQGDTWKRCSVDQSGTSVTFRNEQSQTGNGHFVNPSVVQVDWGYMGGHAMRGTISANLNRIDWSNGTYWTRGSGGVPAASPTPNPYRTLQFATERSSETPGPINVLGGWGAVARDGKSAVVCVSFKNERPLTAARVVFEFPLLNRQGETVDTLRLDRRGEFSSNVDIRGWDSLGSWQSGLGHRGYNDNCTVLKLQVAAMSLLSAHVAGYRVDRVEFTDGTVWPSQ
jgi:hypothetical protein